MKTNFHFWKKVGLLCLCYWAILLWEGCGSSIVDSCGENGCPIVEFPFMEYKSIAVNPTQLTIAPGEALFLNVSALDIEFIACHDVQQPWKLGLLNSALACSCVGNGNKGDKFTIEAVNLYTNKPFSSGRPIDIPLNDLFSVESRDNNGFRTTPLDEVTADNSIRLNGSMVIQGSARPDDLDEDYVFTIEILKSNGDRLTVDTEAIRWLQ
ncbi:MAG: hypothetical protein KTR30_12890 [Saprospiraceae bacterium]|nr:hypothetical protein [Saprospiraceae bacterium]